MRTYRAGSCCSATGKTQVGRPSDEAARAAAAQNVPIYTIAYGTEGGTINVQGREEPVPVDKAELARVSRISGGQAYSPLAGRLRDVYKDIGSSVGKEKVDQEVTSRYAGFGLFLAILGRPRHGVAGRALAVAGPGRRLDRALSSSERPGKSRVVAPYGGLRRPTADRAQR